MAVMKLVTAIIFLGINTVINTAPMVCFLSVFDPRRGARGETRSETKEKGREETKGQFGERSVLANAPSFWLLGSRNIKNHSFLCQSSTAGKDLFEEISVHGTICQNHPFAPKMGMSDVKAQLWREGPPPRE